MSISVIIPVLNEEQRIGPCLDRLLAHPERDSLEIVVVDGGSSDATVQEVGRRGMIPVFSDPGRGRQQHCGAEAASGNIFLFLHCDTFLPNSFFEDICLILQKKNIAAGAFRLNINECGIGFRLLEVGVQLRSSLLQLPYGDQALFMRRETYFLAKGFPRQAIMEDVTLVSRLKKLGGIAFTRSHVTTSARRWQQHGLLKTTLINQLMLIGRAIGISPQQLARFYYAKRE